MFFFLKISKKSETFSEQFIPLVFQRLLTFATYACHNPQTISSSTTQSSPIVEKVPYNASKTNELVQVNFVPFGEKCLTLLTNTYEECAEQESVIENQIFKSIVKVCKNCFVFKILFN